MTERELAAKFTPPDPKLAAVRNAIIRRLETEVVELNRWILADPSFSQKGWLASRRDGITYAVYLIRDLIDGEGKILREDRDPILRKFFEEEEKKENTL